jgi:hypothetical protein
MNLTLPSWVLGFSLVGFSGFELIDRSSSNEYRLLCFFAILLCCLSSLHGRPVNVRDWRLLKVTAAQLSTEVNRVECDWSGHLSSSVALDLESITNGDESDPPGPYTEDEM